VGVPNPREIACPLCGVRHRPPLKQGWNFIPCKEDHGIVVYVDEAGDIREIHGAAFSPTAGGLEIVESKLHLVPRWIDIDRVRAVIEGSVRPSEADRAAISLLMNMGILRRRV